MVINTGRRGRYQVIFFSQTDKVFGVVTSSSIQSLDGKCCLSSDVLDEVFKFMSSKLKCVESLSYINMEPYATESFNLNYLKEKLSEHRNILIISILEKHHWFSIIFYLNEKVLDSMSLEIKLKYLQKMLQIISPLFQLQILKNGI